MRTRSPWFLKPSARALGPFQPRSIRAFGVLWREPVRHLAGAEIGAFLLPLAPAAAQRRAVALLGPVDLLVASLQTERLAALHRILELGEAAVLGGLPVTLAAASTVGVALAPVTFVVATMPAGVPAAMAVAAARPVRTRATPGATTPGATAAAITTAVALAQRRLPLDRCEIRGDGHGCRGEREGQAADDQGRLEAEPVPRSRPCVAHGLAPANGTTRAAHGCRSGRFPGGRWLHLPGKRPSRAVRCIVPTEDCETVNALAGTGS